MAELQMSTISELQTCDKAFEQSANWKKALRFADEKLSAELQQYVLEHTYRMGVSAKMAAQSETDYKTAAGYFSRVAGFRDADQLVEQCLNIAENEPKYKQAIALQEQDTVQSLEQAAAIYDAISPYKDSARNAETCRKRIPVLQKELHQKEKIQTASKKRNRIIAAIAGIVAVLVVAVTVAMTQVVIPGNEYKQAEKLLAAGDYYGAATTFSKAGSYNDAKDRAFDLWGEITNRATIAAGYRHTVGVKSDGTVVAVGDNSGGQCNVSGWTDIVAVAVGDKHTVGLKSDGTVVAVGDNSGGQCNVSSWSGIVAITAGGYYTVGLKSDGTVVAVGMNRYGQCNISDWTDIVSIAVGGIHTVGLKSDSTVVAVGYNGDGQCDVSKWTGIVSVAAGSTILGGYNTIGLKSDGTVVITARNYSVSNWTDIVAVAAGSNQIVGLKSNGTVVIEGHTDNLSGWTDIVAVACGSGYTVSLKSDGTVVAVGDNSDGQCDVSGWTNIKLPN